MTKWLTKCAPRNMTRRLAWVSLFFLLFSMLHSLNVSANFTFLSIQPQAIRIFGADQQFEINLTVTDVSDLYGWEISLYYSPALLNGTSIIEGPFLKEIGSTFFISSINDNYNATHGRATASCSLLGNISGVSGSGVIAKIAFKTKTLGFTLLTLSNTKLGNPASQLITHTPMNGAVEVVAPIYDLAIKDTTLSGTEVPEGRTVEVYVTIANEGNRTEEFTINLYANDTLVETDGFAGLTAGEVERFTVYWNTTGTLPNSTYQIKSEILPVPGETDLEDNIFADGLIFITPRFHDIGINGLTLEHTTVFEGQKININVAVANNGAYDETFNLTLYYDNSTIGIRSLANLPLGASLNLSFIWDTAGVPSNRSYTLKAIASQVPEETSVLNNTFVDGMVEILPREALSVTPTSIVPCNQIGQPVGSFAKGTVAYLKITIYSNSMNTEPLLLTINIYDAGTKAIGVISFKGPAAPGVTTFILGSPIPTAAGTGTAKVYVNSLTDWPHLGGIPYGPEKSASFQITGS